jgi:CxxC motif-containing protein
MKHNKCERLERWSTNKIRTAKNLCSSLLRAEVASTSMIVIKGDDTRLVKLGDTSPNDLIGTILE